jgi:aconitase B
LPTFKEPIICCPKDPDAAKLLSEVSGTHIDEAFIGSFMTKISHFRAAAKLSSRSSRSWRIWASSMAWVGVMAV